MDIATGGKPTELRDGRIRCLPILETFPQSNDRCVVTIAVGTEATELAQFTLPRMERYARKHDADMLVITDDRYPHYPLANKFRLANLPHQQCVFFDIDVWLTDQAPNLFRPGIWMHADRPFLLDTKWLDDEHRRLVRECGVGLGALLKCYNTGVVAFDDPRIWTPPPKPFTPSHTTEQTWVELQSRHLGIRISPLETTNNTQAWFPDFANRQDANIIHLANLPHADRMTWLRVATEKQWCELAKHPLQHNPVTSVTMIYSLGRKRSCDL